MDILTEEVIESGFLCIFIDGHIYPAKVIVQFKGWDTEGSWRRVGTALRYVKGSIGVPRVDHGRMVIVHIRLAVYYRSISVLGQRISQVNLQVGEQGLTLVGIIAARVDQFHRVQVVEQGRHQRRKLTGEAVRNYIYMVDVGTVTAIGVASDVESLRSDDYLLGVSYEAFRRAGRAGVLDNIQIAVVVLVHQVDDGSSDVVVALLVAQRFRCLDVTAHNASGEVDRSIVPECEGGGDIPVEERGSLHIVRVGGVASCKGMSILSDFHVVVADRHTDGKFSVGVGRNQFAVLAGGLSVHIDHTILHGDGRVRIAHNTVDLEGRFIGKVHAAVHQRRTADKAAHLVGCEGVYAHRRDDGIGSTVAREGDTADGVVALAVGQAVHAELVAGGHFVRHLHGFDAAMTAVGHTAFLRVVVGQS